MQVAQASLALTLTPSSLPSVFRPIKPPWSALALLPQFESGVLPDVFGCVECRFSAYKGTREAELRNSFIFTFPPNLPLAKGGLWQVSTCSPSVNTYYQHSALALRNAVRVRLSAHGLRRATAKVVVRLFCIGKSVKMTRNAGGAAVFFGGEVSSRSLVVL